MIRRLLQGNAHRTGGSLSTKKRGLCGGKKVWVTGYPLGKIFEKTVKGHEGKTTAGGILNKKGTVSVNELGGEEVSEKKGSNVMKEKKEAAKVTR